MQNIIIANLKILMIEFWLIKAMPNNDRVNIIINPINFISYSPCLFIKEWMMRIMSAIFEMKEILNKNT